MVRPSWAPSGRWYTIRPDGADRRASLVALWDKVKVTLAGTRRAVIVTITGRLSSNRRIVDLSVAAARQLGMINRGLAEVSLHPV
jgi:hypothetical protein